MMIIHEGYENLKLNSTVVTLGIFDGVHRGHRALIDYLVSVAQKKNCESVVITKVRKLNHLLVSYSQALLILQA